MKVKAGYTVEAALLCPFLCLLIVGMVVLTLELYDDVEAYAGRLTQWTGQQSSVELIRIEAVAEELLEEVTLDAGGVQKRMDGYLSVDSSG